MKSLSLLSKLSLATLLSVLGGALGGWMPSSLMGFGASQATEAPPDDIAALLREWLAQYRSEHPAELMDDSYTDDWADDEADAEAADEAAYNAGLAAYRRWLDAGRRYLWLNWICGGFGMAPLWRSLAWKVRSIFQRRDLGTTRNCALFVARS